MISSGGQFNKCFDGSLASDRSFLTLAEHIPLPALPLHLPLECDHFSLDLRFGCSQYSDWLLMSVSGLQVNLGLTILNKVVIAAIMLQ